MYVFGYTSDKDVVIVDLPIEVVVAIGIDPWRLDLFDPDPIMLDVDGQTLRFTRIGDVVFAYKSGKDIVVAMHDGKEPTCIRGNLSAMLEDYSDYDSVMLRNIRPIKGAFRRYLSHYLRRIFEAEDAHRLWAPRPADHLYVRNRFVRLRSISFPDGRNAAFWMQCRFVGEMFTRLDARCAMPPSIARVLKGLERWDPIVFGPGLSDLLLGKPVACLDVRISNRESANEENIEGVAYRICSRSHCGKDSKEYPTTGTQSQALKVTDRVSLYDAIKNQARPLAGGAATSRHPRITSGWWSMEHEPAPGVRLLPDVFSPTHVANNCHCEPIVPIYAELLRRAWCDPKPLALTFDAGIGTNKGIGSALWADMHHGRPERTGQFISTPPEYKSWQHMRNILLELSSDTLRKSQSGQRSSACFTTREFADYLRGRIVSNWRLSPDARYLWCEWLDSMMEQDVRFRLSADIRENVFYRQREHCDRLFATYLQIARAELAGNTSLSLQQRLLLTGLEASPPLSLAPGEEREFRIDLLRMADDFDGVMNYRKRDRNVSYRSFESVGAALECYVLNQPPLAAPPSEDDENENPGAACAYWIHKALIRDFGYCDHCAQQFFTEGARHGFRKQIRPTM